MSVWNFKNQIKSPGRREHGTFSSGPVVTAILAAVFMAASLVYVLNPVEVQAYASDFDTPSFRTEVTVNSDNSFYITETITVDFHKAKHGIYRYIPME